MVDIHKTLLHIEFSKLTGDQIVNIRNDMSEMSDTYGKYMPYNDDFPKYSLNTNGTIELTEDRHSETERDSREYILFDIYPTDKWLCEEIDNGGLDELLNKINLNNVLDKFSINTYETRGRFNKAEYLILKLTYRSYSFENEYDVSVDTELIGCISGNNLNFELF
jgi:hypothetical protein